MLICFLCDAEVAESEARIGLRGRILCSDCFEDYGGVIPPVNNKLSVFVFDLTCPICGRTARYRSGFLPDARVEDNAAMATCPECGHRFPMQSDPEADPA